MFFTQHGGVLLEIAASNGHIETVQRLLETNGSVNYQNKVITTHFMPVYLTPGGTTSLLCAF